MSLESELKIEDQSFPTQEKQIERVVYSRQGRLNATQFFLGERFFENLAQEKLSRLSNYSYGFEEIELDSAPFARGRIGLIRAKGILPDGTPFSIPSKEEAPELLKITQKYFEKGDEVKVYLALPFNQNAMSIESHYSAERYSHSETQVDDETFPIVLNKFITITSTENLQNFSALQISQLMKEEGKASITINPFFIPPMLNILNHKKAKGMIDNLHETIRTKITEINQLYVSLNRSRFQVSAHVIDALMLQLLNKYDGYFKSILKQSSLHPYELYKKLILFSAEMASYVSESKVTKNCLPYNHENFELNLTELLYEIKHYLNYTLERDALEVQLKRNYIGTFHTETMKPSQMKSVYFIVAITSNRPKHEIQKHLPNQSKISAPSQIEHHIRTMSAGVRLVPLIFIPPSVPYNHNYVYFNMTFSIESDEIWKQIFEEGKISYHISGDYPNLDIRLWLVKEEKAFG